MSYIQNDDWEHYKAKAEAAFAAGDYAQSEVLWATAVLLAEHFGDTDFRLAKSLDYLSQSLLRQKKYRLAEVFLVRSWKIKTKVSAATFELAKTLNMVAELFFQQGRISEAEQLCERVYIMYRDSYGAEHSSTVTAANNLATLRRVRKSQEEAVQSPGVQAVNPTAVKPPTAGQNPTPVQSPAGQGGQNPTPVQSPAAQGGQNPTPVQSPAAQGGQNETLVQSGQYPRSEQSPTGQAGQNPTPVQAQTGQAEQTPMKWGPDPDDPKSGYTGSVLKAVAYSGVHASKAILKAYAVSPKCDSCGNDIQYEGDECQRCTGTKMKAINPLDRLT